MRWASLEYVAEANAGDSSHPPYARIKINASSDETLECVLVRSDNEAVVVNLDIERSKARGSPLRRPDPQTELTNGDHPRDSDPRQRLPAGGRVVAR